ncbi:unnamed protein product [Rotaria magnacalcarata]|uniref:LITAF domain-containing protein n=1 Tax=Rotaria magnacalcarata TaxID=392030 RepID=A0A819F9L6_9BILA|nr:unnamed protein product [Rotaria magnacalcarata]CAF3861081.1 unnamed protein product [Rotaria magnacalcarata]
MDKQQNNYSAAPSSYPAMPPSYPAAPPSYSGSAYPAPPLPRPIIRGDYPVQCVCTNCQQHIVTRVETKNGLLTWGSCGGICLFGAPFGCFLGCCLIPFCIDALKDKVHFCPNCSVVLGEQKALNM